jgi:hypothetical protein
MPDGIFHVIGIDLFAASELLAALVVFAGVVERNAATPVPRPLVGPGFKVAVEVGDGLAL